MLVRAIDTDLYKNKQYANSLNFSANQNKHTDPHKKNNQATLADDIHSALKVLGDKKLEVIIHNASAPSANGKDIGVGSLYSKTSREVLAPFLAKNGFSAIQVDPEGSRPLHDNSPYVGNSFVYNPLIIDLEDLTKPENGALVDTNVYRTITTINPAKGKSHGDFEHAKDSSKLAIANAWENFNQKASDIESISNPVEKAAIKKLSAQFGEYREKNGEMLEPYALYSILTDVYDNDYYKNWPSDVQNLYNPRNEALIKELTNKYQDEIDRFIFMDMLAKNARDKGIEAYAAYGIKTEGDNPVAFSSQEVWAHPGAFLPDYKMGCPPDGENPEGQGWGFAVLHPGKLFNKDGSLGESGQLLYDKCYKLASDNRGGIRIDHIAGLFDPYVYKNKPNPSDPTAGRLYSSPKNPDLRQYAIPFNTPSSARRFGAIMEKIVIPACEDAGVSKDNIMCENLGAFPEHIREAFDRLGLGGMNITQYHNGMSARPQDTIMLGSHDTAPFVTYVNNLYGEYGQDSFNHALWPAVENSLPKNATHEAKQKEFDKYRFDFNSHHPQRNKEAFTHKKLVELFTSPAKRVQIFWPDLFGSEERYNTPGTTSGNWTYRMSTSLLNSYDPKPIVAALADALRAQDAKTVKANQALIDSLDARVKEMGGAPAGSTLNIKG